MPLVSAGVPGLSPQYGRGVGGAPRGLFGAVLTYWAATVGAHPNLHAERCQDLRKPPRGMGRRERVIYRFSASIATQSDSRSRSVMCRPAEARARATSS